MGTIMDEPNDINLALAFSTFRPITKEEAHKLAQDGDFTCLSEEETDTLNDDGYRQITDEEREHLLSETKRIHAEFRALRRASASPEPQRDNLGNHRPPRA